MVKAYYNMQEDRIRVSAQAHAKNDANAPHEIMTWVSEQHSTLEKQVARALDRYSGSRELGRWARCAPPGSMVAVGSGWSSRKEVPIETLHDGDGVTSYNRHHASTTSPRPVTVGVRPYAGTLVGLHTSDHATWTTPNHQWIVRLNRKDFGLSVYLMRSGDRFRVGRCNLFSKRGGDRYRLGIQQRTCREKADVWILRTLSTEREAAVYEQYVSTHYGITEWPFIPPAGNRLIGSAETAELFALLDAADQRLRAEKCLADHGKLIDHPLYSWAPGAYKQSGTRCMKIAAANLIPEIMEIPLPLRQCKTDWAVINELSIRDYEGPVYSLDVAQHHTYIQDGVITCNSICGIGPIIAAGLMAHIDIRKAPTVGHIWRYAGLDPTVKWGKGEKRPWNSELKVLCWKLGESFVKVSGNENDVYGKVYKARKADETTRNEAGAFADQAAASLTEKRFGKDTEAFKHYTAGRLPPARIHLRATRYAVKLFLSHYHHVAHEIEFDTPPPKPYILAHGEGHVHYLGPPNWPMVEG